MDRERKLLKQISLMHRVLESYREDYCNAAGLGGSIQDREMDDEYQKILAEALEAFPQDKKDQD